VALPAIETLGCVRSHAERMDLAQQALPEVCQLSDEVRRCAASSAASRRDNSARTLP